MYSTCARATRPGGRSCVLQAHPRCNTMWAPTCKCPDRVDRGTISYSSGRLGLEGCTIHCGVARCNRAKVELPPQSFQQTHPHWFSPTSQPRPSVHWRQAVALTLLHIEGRAIFQRIAREAHCLLTDPFCCRRARSWVTARTAVWWYRTSIMLYRTALAMRCCSPATPCSLHPLASAKTGPCTNDDISFMLMMASHAPALTNSASGNPVGSATGGAALHAGRAPQLGC